MRVILKHIVIPVILLGLSFVAGGQENDGRGVVTASSNTEEEPALLTGIGRWSFKFNAVDLLCTVPNVGVEFDLGSSKFSRMSLGLSVRYNWNETVRGYLPTRVFNVLEIRPEFRRYYRFAERSKNVFYWGVYASGGTYSMKLSQYGHQGKMFGAGGSAGIVFPLHEYRKVAIDMEVGGSLGLCVRDAEGYSLSGDRRSYVSVPGETFGFRVVPWPIASELRVAFVFRKVSVKSRYQLTREEVRALKDRKRKKSDKE